MSVKLIIYISGKPSLHGHKRREFLWVPTHGCYLYGGEEIEPSEFNAKFEKAMKTNSDMNPRVKVIEIKAEPPKAAPPTTDKPKEDPPKDPPVEFPIEKQVTDAVAVLAKYAPERLKKPTRPPAGGAAIEI